MGRKLTTGRFDTREDLVERVTMLYANGAMSMEAIGNSCGCSHSTVKKIIEDQENPMDDNKVVAVTPNESADPFTAMVERLATNETIDADKLDKLVDVQMKIMNRNAEIEFNNAMALVQSQLPVVLAGAENPQTHSRYAKHEAIAKAIKPIYTAEGFSTSFSQEHTDREGFIRIAGTLRHSGGHSVGYFIDLPIDDKGIKGQVNKTPVHATGSTFSYGRRYLTCLMFDVATGDDDDGNVYDDTAISESQAADLFALADELFGEKADAVLESLARRRFHFDDGDWRKIPAYRLVDAQRSLREKAES